MFALGRRSRAAVATAAFAALTAAALTCANGGAGAAPGGDDPPANAAPLPAPTGVALTLPHRDPFAGGAPSAKTTPAPAMPAMPPLPSIPAAIGALPPNLRAASAGARVTAVVTGAHPSALVEEGDAVRLLAPGDAFHDDRVAAIDAAGVHLAHGGTLRVTPAAPLPLMPAASGGRP